MKSSTLKLFDCLSAICFRKALKVDNLKMFDLRKRCPILTAAVRTDAVMKGTQAAAGFRRQGRKTMYFGVAVSLIDVLSTSLLLFRSLTAF
jgi:hypothetical protein